MHALPTARSVKELYDGLLGRPVVVASAVPWTAVDLAGAVAGIYVNDWLRTAAVAGFDLELAARLGAAIGLVPASHAEACVAHGSLSTMLLENVAEVFNVMAVLLCDQELEHVRMLETMLVDQPGHQETAGHLLSPRRRLDLAVDVPGYGTGRLAFCLTG